jgi:hypothetical protein
MKSKYTVGLAGLALTAALTLIHSFGKERFAADGSPAPPKPDNTVIVVGVPAPPWPKGGSSLVTDGAPAPPWPKGDDALVADGAPAPPWPKGESGILSNA